VSLNHSGDYLCSLGNCTPQALVIAKEIPADYSPLCRYRACLFRSISDAKVGVAYVIKLRDVFPLSAPAERSYGSGGAHSGDRLVKRIEELERRLTLARADEAHAKLGKRVVRFNCGRDGSFMFWVELLAYRAKHPAPAPMASELEVASTSSELGKRPAPGSPSSGTKKPAKKKKKQVDASFGGLESKLQVQLDTAVEVIQKCEPAFQTFS
jgi:hypothetical protein